MIIIEIYNNIATPLSIKYYIFQYMTDVVLTTFRIDFAHPLMPFLPVITADRFVSFSQALPLKRQHIF